MGAYARAVEAVERAGREARGARGPYQAGWARVEVRAPAGVPLAGYGDRHGVASAGVKDPCFVRAFAFTAGARAPLLVFASDLLLITPEIAREVRARLRGAIDARDVHFTASHTHSGPGGYAGGAVYPIVTGAYDPRALEAIVAAHAEAGALALWKLAPARIGSASVAAPGLITNRVEKGGPTDDRLFVLRFERLAGGAAALWSFACHAVTLPPENLLLSADYPGTIAAALEGGALEQLGYAAGGVGSSNPAIETTGDAWITRPLQAALRRGLAEARVRSSTAGAVASTEVLVRMPPFDYRVTDQVGIPGPIVEALTGLGTLSYGAAAIGDTLLGFIPAELSGDLAAEARREARRRGIELALFPFAGSYAGYVVPRRVFALPPERENDMHAYETRLMAFHGRAGGDLTMNLAVRLTRAIHGAARAAW